MVAQAQALVGARSRTFAIVACAVIGFSLLMVAGHIQASTLHDAAHDVRHFNGFPCH